MHGLAKQTQLELYHSVITKRKLTNIG